jgi:hypothetical protein
VLAAPVGVAYDLAQLFIGWHTVVPDPSDVDEETVCLKLNTDFETAHLNGNDLSALVSAWQAGAISQDTLLHNLRQGEILPPGRSGEEEVRLIGKVRKCERDAVPQLRGHD